MTTTATTADVAAPSAGMSRLWRRELDHYPAFGARVGYLTIVVVTTVLFYYQYYVISGVSDQVIAGTGASFMFFVNINVVSALASALTSALGGICDRIGRANVVTVGVLACALVCVAGFPFAHGRWSVGILYALLGAIEGTVLVATPALVRDFSPQMGRASAMGFWTIGPVAGSLITSVVVTNTIAHLTAWQDEYTIAGIAGLAVFVISLVSLRELSPRLRDQVIVSEHDRALVELRARGIDVEGALAHPWRQMVKPDIVGPAFAISLFLIIYYTAVGFFPLFFQTVFGWSTSQANAIGNWMWGFQAFGLVAIGWSSDRLRVRKPFMLVGALAAVVCTLVFMADARHTSTGYYAFVVILVLLGFSLAQTFAPWMAAFTETVERRNPALTATGLAIWGLVLRMVVTVSAFVLPFVVHSVTTVADNGTTAQLAAAGQDPALTPAQNKVVKAVVADPGIVTKVEALATRYASQLSTANAIDPATQAALTANPGDGAAISKALSEISAGLHVSQNTALTRLLALAAVPQADLNYLSTYGTQLQNHQVQSTLELLQKVQTAQVASRSQWQHYFWIAVGGEIVFIPLIFLMAGAWRPRTARRNEEEHDRLVAAELASLQSGGETANSPR